MRVLLNLLIQCAGFLLLWLLFVFQFSVSELLVGAGASILTVLALRISLNAVPLCFRPRFRWIAQGWRLPGMIALDLWILLKDFSRRLVNKPSNSRLELWEFRVAGPDCRESAQRALALLFVCTSPNSVVLDVNRERGNMLIHQLQSAPVPKLVRKLQE